MHASAGSFGGMHAGSSAAMDSSVAPKGEGVLTLRGVDISYEILGGRAGGVPVVLTPGGGGGKGGFRWLAQRLRTQRQCLIWDRPNCGASGLTLGDDVRQPEPDMQADFLHELLHNLGMAPAILLGKSNGARLSLIMAAKYPEDVAGLILLNVTNGTKAAKRLSAERCVQRVCCAVLRVYACVLTHAPPLPQLLQGAGRVRARRHARRGGRAALY
jgi:pimeloyl-ACP methyl ester carboxylesterase